MIEEGVEAANKLLAAHTLAALRLHSWEPSLNVAGFEVFHIDWPMQVFGRIEFVGVSYLQCPASTSWGFRGRMIPNATLPSKPELDSSETLYEFYAPDGQEPSAYVVAESQVVALE